MTDEQTKLPAVPQISPLHILEKAIGEGIDTEQLLKLMDLHDRWLADNAKKAYLEAKAEFTGKKPELKKDRLVSFDRTKYKYLPLGRLQSIVDPLLAEVGLTYHWEQTQKDGKIRITCVVSHIDGHSESCWLEAERDNSGKKNQIQSTGSTVSYLKRYTFENALGIATDYDDDGQEGGKAQSKPKRKPSPADWKRAVNAFEADKTNVGQLRELFELNEAHYSDLWPHILQKVKDKKLTVDQARQLVPSTEERDQDLLELVE